MITQGGVSGSGDSPENIETFSSLLLSLGDGFGLGWFNMQALVNCILLSIIPLVLGGRTSGAAVDREDHCNILGDNHRDLER